MTRYKEAFDVGPVELKTQIVAAAGSLWSTKFGALLAGVATVATKYFGDCPEAVQQASVAALVFFVVDTILGITRAIADKEVSSRGFGQGLIKLVVYICILAMGVGVDTLMNWQHMAPLFLLYWIITREGISGIENANALGFPLPAWLKDILEKYKDTAEEGPGQ